MNVKDFLGKYGGIGVGILFLVVIVFFNGLPPFWDMYGQVRTALRFEQIGFGYLSGPPSGEQLSDWKGYSDNGHFPLYAMYLAALFKLAGFKLWVVHLSVFPFVAGIIYQLKKISERFLSPVQTFFVLLLTLLNPVILAQVIHSSAEISFVFFALWLIQSLLDERASHIALSSVFLCLVNLRGISLVTVLLVYFLLFKKQKTAWYLLAGILSWVSWVVIHFYVTGTPWGNEVNEFRAVASVEGMGRNCVFSLLKLIDSGHLLIWLLIFLCLARNKKWHALFTCVLLAVLSVLFISIPFTNPVNNRYFLLVYVLLLPALVYAASHYNVRILISLLSFVVLFLFSADRFVYPNRFGNAWDCTLKSLSYFSLRDELNAYVEKSGIEPFKVSAGFQLYFTDEHRMDGPSMQFSLLSDTEMPQTDYVADSDICNNYNAEREAWLKQYYHRIKSFTREGIYINLYMRNK